MQVVVVGAGRADLVTQHGTRLDPGGIATRSGQSRSHQGTALSEGCVLMAQDEGRGEAIPQQAVLRRPSLWVLVGSDVWQLPMPSDTERVFLRVLDRLQGHLASGFVVVRCSSCVGVAA